MKRFILTLTTIFICTIAYAHTINWHIGDTVTTTTCDSGDSITPPTPIGKYGYHFKKWTAFTQIEYLGSVDASYIDTGFYPNQDTSIKIKIQLDYSGEGPYGFGSDSKYEFFVWSRGTKFLYSNGGTYAAYEGSRVVGGDILEIDWNKNDIKYYINNVFQPEITAIYARFNTQYPLYLFALKRANSSPQYVGGVKIYYFQMYDNNIIVRDMIPVLDKNGVPCMFDKVEGKFYYNAGTGQFIAGPVIRE